MSYTYSPRSATFQQLLAWPNEKLKLALRIMLNLDVLVFVEMEHLDAALSVRAGTALVRPLGLLWPIASRLLAILLVTIERTRFKDVPEVESRTLRRHG